MLTNVLALKGKLNWLFKWKNCYVKPISDLIETIILHEELVTISLRKRKGRKERKKSFNSNF